MSRMACSGRAVLSTIIAFKPPVSAIKGADGLPDAAIALLIRFAVVVEPVKHTPSILGLATNVAPISAPVPINNCNALCGTPAAYINSTTRVAMMGVGSAGLANTAFPVAKAAEI